MRTLWVQNHGNLIYFGDVGFLFMEDCAPFAFLVSWALVALYLCFRFYIFDRFWKSMFLGLVGGGPTYSSHVYMQREMTFLLQLGNCIIFLKT